MCHGKKSNVADFEILPVESLIWNDLVSCGNNLLTCGNDLVSRGNDLLTLGIKMKK